MSSTDPKMIGIGSYGCVYRPPPCRTPSMTGPDYEYVGKLVAQKDVSTELAVSERLREAGVNWEPYVAILLGDSCSLDTHDPIYEDCQSRTDIPFEGTYEVYPSRYAGIPLWKYLDEPVTYKWLWEAFRQLVRTLDFIHSWNIYHNDIRSDNILVDETGAVRLIDFGLAIMDPTPESLAQAKLNVSTENPLFYNLYIYQHNGESLSVKSLRKDYSGIATFYFPSYEPDTASDYIRIAIYISEQEKYVEKVVIPNFEKIDLYQLASAFSDILNDGTTTIDESGDDDIYQENLTVALDKCAHIDVNQQWTVKEALSHMGKL